ncbi:MAG: hypothetical protein MUF54_14545, partial [Polyangiaceae bacterium]|nr:hypothetical protein [Polyangiaceae bacterium]
MSSLRSKLQRLGSVGPEAKVVPPPEPVTVPAAAEAEAQADRAQVLERLRLKIAHIVARQAPAPLPPADPSTGELPFTAEDTPSGRLYVRHVLFEPNHRVGRFPLHTARVADPVMLSLLALDPTLAAVEPGGALYLDTETTGLSGGTGTLPFLIGLGLFQGE